MKNLFVFFLFLFITASLNAQWQMEVPLTSDPTNSYTSFGNARCIATDGNTIHVVWYDGVTIAKPNWEIFYKRSTDGGLNWSANVNLSNNDSISYNPAIAVSGNYVHVVWYDNLDSKLDVDGKPDWNYEEYYKRSTDGGITWGPVIRLTNNAYKSLHPSIFVSGLNVHIVWNDNRDGNYEVYYKNSADRGDNWSADMRLSYTAGKSWIPAVAVSGSVVHVAWHDSTAGNWEIYYKRSIDGGISWGADTRLTNNSASSEYPTLAVSGSIVHIAWNDFRNGTIPNIYYKRSTNGGLSWGTDTRLSMKNSNYDLFPSLELNGSNLHLVFYSHRTTGKYASYDIIYKKSTNDGVTWGSDVQLTNNRAHSVVPSIAVSGTNVHVIFRDNREGNYEIYYKRYIGPSLQKGLAVVEQEEGLPSTFELTQNYPNPFNPSTVISYQLPVAGYVTLKIYDLLGSEISTLVNEYQQAGIHNSTFNTQNLFLPSGIYFYRLQTSDPSLRSGQGFVDMKKMILVK